MNKFSLAVDADDIQFSIGNSLRSWNSSSPTGMINIFVTVDNANTTSTMYTVTSTASTQRLTLNRVPDIVFDFLRIARGTSGDGNHQDNEYLSDGSVRSISFWNRVLSTNEMQDVCDVLDVKRLLVV